ncbi:MAG: hypothetical protein M3150_10440, partial [Pseudomonadota bacterium]|nr:hypothetical protein [Pseudomonadota bacterium]
MDNPFYKSSPAGPAGDHQSTMHDPMTTAFRHRFALTPVALVVCALLHPQVRAQSAPPAAVGTPALKP